MQSYIAGLRSQLSAVMQQRDEAQQASEALRVRAQRAELALAREIRATRTLAQRVKTLEDTLVAQNVPLPAADGAAS